MLLKQTVETIIEHSLGFVPIYALKWNQGGIPLRPFNCRTVEGKMPLDYVFPHSFSFFLS